MQETLAISASSLTFKWVAEGEKMVRALFAVAKVRRAWGHSAISTSSLTSKWVGKGEEIVRDLCCSQSSVRGRGFAIYASSAKYMEDGEKKSVHAFFTGAKMSWMGWSELKGGGK